MKGSHIKVRSGGQEVAHKKSFGKHGTQILMQQVQCGSKRMGDPRKDHLGSQFQIEILEIYSRHYKPLKMVAII